MIVFKEIAFMYKKNRSNEEHSFGNFNMKNISLIKRKSYFRNLPPKHSCSIEVCFG